MEPKYKRVALKITGEALKSSRNIFDRKVMESLAKEIESVYGVTELAIIIGGGNIIRGRELQETLGTDSTAADYAGMVATIVNAQLIGDFLQRRGVEIRLMSSLEINKVAEPFIYKRAIRHLEKNRVIILAGGTGKSGVTTDMAAVLLASEIKADVVLKGTKVDGVYNVDPKVHKDAILQEQISYREFIGQDFGTILDKSAVAQAKGQKMPIFVFNVFKKGNLKRAVCGKAKGTLIS